MATVAPPKASSIVLVLVVGGILILRYPGIGLVFLLATVVSNAANVATNVQGLPIFGVLIIPILAAVALIGKLRNGEDTRMEQLVAVVAVASVVLRSISLFWVEDPEPTYLALGDMAKDWVFALLIVAFIPSVRELRWAVRTVAYTGGAIALLGVVQYVTGSFGNDFLGFATASVKQISGDIHSWRLSGPFPDSNYFGQALVMVLPLAVGICIVDRRFSLRLLGLISVAAILAAIVLTFSRGALGAVVLMALAAILLMRARWRVLASLCVVALVAIAAAPHRFLDRIGTIAQALHALLFGGAVIEDPSLSGRIAVMTAALDMFKDHPWLGIGFAQYEAAFGDYALAGGLDPGVPPHAHSLYLEIAAEGGLLGLAAFFVVAGGTALIALRGIARLQAKGRSAGAVMGISVAIGFLGYLATSLFLHDAFPRLFYVEIGLLLAVGRVALANHGKELSYSGYLGRDVMQANLRDHHPFPPIDIFALLWRSKWFIILFAIAGAVLAGFYTLTAPRKYMAESTLLYRFGREYSPVLPGEQGRSWGESIQVSLDTAMFTEMRLLRNAEVLKEATRTVGPAMLEARAGPAAFGVADIEAVMRSWLPVQDDGAGGSRDAAVQQLADALTVRRVEGTTMLAVAVRHSNPQVAERAADAVVAAYQAKRRELFNRDAADFYARQINDTQAQLAEIQAKRTVMLKAQGVSELGAERAIAAEQLKQIEQQAIIEPANDELSSRIATTRQTIADLDVLRNQLDVLDIRRNAAAANLSRLIDLRDRSLVDASYADTVEPAVEIVENAAGDAAPVGGSLATRIGLGAAFGVAIGAVYVLLSALARRRPVMAAELV